MYFPKDSQMSSYSELGSPSPDSGAFGGRFAISESMSRVRLTSCFLIVRTILDSCDETGNGEVPFNGEKVDG